VVSGQPICQLRAGTSAGLLPTRHSGTSLHAAGENFLELIERSAENPLLPPALSN